VRFIEKEGPDCEWTTELFEAPLNLNEEDADEHNVKKARQKVEEDEDADDINDVASNDDVASNYDTWIIPNRTSTLKKIDAAERDDRSFDDESEPSTLTKDMDSKTKRGPGRSRKIKTGNWVD